MKKKFNTVTLRKQDTYQYAIRNTYNAAFPFLFV